MCNLLADLLLKANKHNSRQNGAIEPEFSEHSGNDAMDRLTKFGWMESYEQGKGIYS